MKVFKYTKLNRIRKTCDYIGLSKGGSKYFSDYFIVIIMRNNSHFNRLGITVSKKVGNAVKRNRVKRVIRECFRLYINKVVSSLDINIIAKKGTGIFSSSALVLDLRKLFENKLLRRFLNWSKV